MPRASTRVRILLHGGVMMRDTARLAPAAAGR